MASRSLAWWPKHVEKVNPDLVARDEQGKAYTVRYEAVNAMLLNEFLKEHRKVEALDATVAAQKNRLRVADCGPYRSPQSTGSANPEGERPASDTGSCSACRGE